MVRRRLVVSCTGYTVRLLLNPRNYRITGVAWTETVPQKNSSHSNVSATTSIVWGQAALVDAPGQR